MWAQTTGAANWMMTQMYVRDARRRNGEEKSPAPPRVYLYPEARELFPDLPPQTVTSLEQAVQRRYRASRYDLIWRCSKALPTARYPQPYPVNVQSWEYRFDEGGRPIVRLRRGEGVKWWELRLKSGPQFRRQLDGLKRMVEKGELAVYRQHGSGSIMVKLVGWLPRPQIKAGTQGTLYVRTGPDAVLMALDQKAERIWVENCALKALDRGAQPQATTVERRSEGRAAARAGVCPAARGGGSKAAQPREKCYRRSGGASGRIRGAAQICRNRV
jgi:hypothetical protein